MIVIAQLEHSRNLGVSCDVALFPYIKQFAPNVFSREDDMLQGFSHVAAIDFSGEVCQLNAGLALPSETADDLDRSDTCRLVL